jgi:hypothetical protein
MSIPELVLDAGTTEERDAKGRLVVRPGADHDIGR